MLMVPHSADAAQTPDVVAMLNAQSCSAQAYAQYEDLVSQLTPGPTPQPTPNPNATPVPAATPTPIFGATPGPSASPSPLPTVSFAPSTSGTTTLYETPRPPAGVATAAPPPPVPTATPPVSLENQPVFVQRGGATPPPITPAGEAAPSPSPQPTGVPTLAPNQIAVLADNVQGGTKQGQPADVTGNVHILYQHDEIVGDKAHYDGIRTVTITGHSYVFDHLHNSVLRGDPIVFDTIDQTAQLKNASGTSAQGVERGLVFYQGTVLNTDPNGVGHGLAPSVSTCTNPRAGYHITGKNFDVYPGDKIVIYKAILWLGAAAVFFLPKVVIPLRTVTDETQKPQYFPEVGYDQYEGYWVKTRISYGRDQNYYGYYIVNFFTKVGLGLGYVAFYQNRRGRRSGSVNYYRIHDKRTDTATSNLTATEIENFSRTLRGNFTLNYQSNYGPYTNLPANTNFSSSIAHQGVRSSQNYGYNRSAIGSQSSTNSISFTDQRQITQLLSQGVNFSLTSAQSNFGGFATSNSTAHFNSLTHLATSNADYQLTIDKNFSQQPYGINKLPELQIRPYKFLSHFVMPVSATFTAGEYSEPSNRFSTQRADMQFVLGPELAHVLGSDFQGTINVRQDAYGTGDLKAQIQQVMTLTTALGKHFVNTISYNESNYNGPGQVPFQYLDQQPEQNTHNAQDLVRIFNSDVYNLQLGFSTNFNMMAQPVSYQLTAKPTSRSIVLLGGSFVPGVGQGFYTTNVQVASPFGRDASIQFLGDLDWKNKGRIENKVLYYNRVIGNCYELQALYNQAQKLVTFQINLLAFPSRSATFAVGQSGPIIPMSGNF